VAAQGPERGIYAASPLDGSSAIEASNALATSEGGKPCLGKDERQEPYGQLWLGL